MKHKTILILLLVLSGCVDEPITLDHTKEYSYTKEGWPANVDAAVYEILKDMDAKNQTEVRSTKEEDLILFHHGWGTGIRNEFGLWKGNDSLIQSACGEQCHPDDASMKIIEAVWAKLHEKP